MSEPFTTSSAASAGDECSEAGYVDMPAESSRPSSWSAPGQQTEPPEPPLEWREPVSLLLIVALSDLTIYRGGGFAGFAVLFLVAPVLLVVGAARRRAGVGLWILGPMLVVLAARLLWCGSSLSVGVGFAALVGFAMGLAGLRPYVLEAVVFAAQTVVAGYRRLTLYWRAFNLRLPPVMRTHWLSIALPAAALLLFSVLFILANPDLVETFSERLRRLAETVRRWLVDFSPQPWEFVFWVVTAWLASGLMRPAMDQLSQNDTDRLRFIKPDSDAATGAATSAPLYAAFRNTLVVVIVLFAGYLAFEFKTLWFRVFEKGFHYSGYAHEGAAWLTVALALATLILSAIFRGRILGDPRLPRLRRLAWLWSLENMLLAIAVYHRLFIYIGFNGMTRMRTVALYGMSAVVVGFLMVLWKIARNHDFVWLMRRHLWTLAAAIYLYAITPLDAIAMHYNVRRILAGDPAPCVQISVHPISAEGILVLTPLLDCDDAMIREGLRAMLAQRLDDAEREAGQRQRDGWTARQFADDRLLEMLRAARTRLSEYSEGGVREGKLKEFHGYAYQWF